MKTETIYGIHPVFEALQAKRRTFHELYILKGKTNARVEHIIEIAHLAKIPIQYLQRQKLQSLTGVDTHQGVAARVSPYPLLDLSDLISDNSFFAPKTTQMIRP